MVTPDKALVELAVVTLVEVGVVSVGWVDGLETGEQKRATAWLT